MAALDIRAALTRHPLVAPLVERRQALQQQAAQASHVNEVDGAGCNDRLHHVEASETKSFETNCAFDLVARQSPGASRISRDYLLFGVEHGK